MVQLRGYPFVVTENLFSKHYLERRVTEHERWRDKEEYREIFEEIKGIYQEEKNVLEGYSELQLRDHFIRPILKKLKLNPELDPAADQSNLTPDYAFFKTEDSRREAIQIRSRGEDYYPIAIAVGEAKKWNIPLDKKRGEGSVYERDNPSYQINRYLRKTHKRWGVLTNGKIWRLYFVETSESLESYYEIDLEEIIKTEDISGFRYFYTFFERDSFIEDATGKNFLDAVYKQGLTYAKEVGKDLQKNIYEALRTLCQGYLDFTANSFRRDEETINTIHYNSLIYLYRILFVLYADARGMLQTKKTGYGDYDIDNVKDLAVGSRRDPESLGEYSTSIWDKLNKIFNIVNIGSESEGIPKEDLFVPPYNGGLFSNEKYPFLSEQSRKKVGDRALVEVLEYLTMTGERGRREFIDYSTLNVRHLGSIYEGLLEFKLEVADTDKFVKKTNKGETWGSRDEFDGDFDALPDNMKVKQGDIYLATDKGERKATGSYYTPDYIVKYIVENTLGPIVEDQIREIPDKEKVEAILSIRVLDPAMGSGHFLVEATNYLARRIAEFVSPEDVDDISEIDWARREVLKKCIYGVDLNPLATELAKLSLWLNSLPKKRPLSFLDHHLIFGDSLIGCDTKNLNRHPKELSVETSSTFISDFEDEAVREKIKILRNLQTTIVSMAEEDLNDVRAKEDIFKQFESYPFRQAFIKLANLHTSFWLGNDFTKDEYYVALEAFRHFSTDPSKWESVEGEEYFKKAQELAKENNFFHWELAFPDVFYKENIEDSGFDIVIGNPPYVRQEQIKELKPVLKEQYTTYNSSADLYVYFYERGHNVLKRGGYFGFICSNKFMKSNYGKALREFLSQEIYIREIIDFGELPVFEDAATFPAIFLTQKIDPSRRTTIYTPIKSLKFESLQNEINSNSRKLGSEIFKEKNWILDASDKLAIFKKMDNFGVPLFNYVNGEIKYGVKTGFNDAFIISPKVKDILVAEDPKSAEIIKPIIIGDDIRKFEIDFRERYLIWTYIGVNLDKYPAIMRHLEGYKEQLKNRSDKGNYWYELRHCNYYEDFNKEKILIPAFALEPKFAIDNGEYFVNAPAYFIPKRDYYLLTLLNSRLCFKYLISLCSVLGDPDKRGRAVLRTSYYKNLPIRYINFTMPKEERGKLVSELKDLYGTGDFERIISLVDSYLPKGADGSFVTAEEKTDVVHGLLEFLAECMIEMNKEKQKEIKGFLEWLERYLNLKIDEMNVKTKVREFFKEEITWDDYYKNLNKSNNKTEVNFKGINAHDDIKEAFDSKRARIGPLMRKIKDTDAMIDKIVYKLYGLTNEEIKVIEEAA